jgi:outer membrane protein insertion porin family/translocation and assembly module TamA
MALFQFVNIESMNPDEQSAEVKTKVTVVEGKHQRANLSVGYGSEEKGRVDASYSHVNFFGAARTAGLHGRYSSLDRGLRLELNQPYFFKPHLSLGGEGQRWYTYTPAYQSIVSGAKATVLHRDGPRMSISVSIESERSTTSIASSVLDDPALRDDLIALGLDPTTGKQEGTLSALGFDIQRTTADNLLNPRRGYQIAIHGEEAGVLLPGSFNYYAIAVDGRYYQPIGSDVVIAGRLQLGNIDAAGASVTNVPFSKKYFLGGATTLRGWGRYEVSPLSSSGLPLGGNSLLGFSLEGRAKLKGSLGAVLFLDAGNVWADSAGFALNDLRYAVGPGLRYQTPVGPIRLDVGYQLNPIDGLLVNGQPQTRRFRIHFSIGQAF